MLSLPCNERVYYFWYTKKFVLILLSKHLQSEGTPGRLEPPPCIHEPSRFARQTNCNLSFLNLTRPGLKISTILYYVDFKSSKLWNIFELNKTLIPLNFTKPVFNDSYSRSLMATEEEERLWRKIIKIIVSWHIEFYSFNFMEEVFFMVIFNVINIFIQSWDDIFLINIFKTLLFVHRSSFCKRKIVSTLINVVNN